MWHYLINLVKINLYISFHEKINQVISILSIIYCIVYCSLAKIKRTTEMGFEPTRAEHNGLAVHRLNHSATPSCSEMPFLGNIKHIVK